MENESFNKISKKLGTEFKPSTIEETEKEIAVLEDKKNLIKGKSISSDLSFEDKKYLQFEIQDLVATGKEVLDILKEDLKVGSPARSFEVFAGLMNSVTNSLKELRELNRNLVQVGVLNKSSNTSIGDPDNPNLTNKIFTAKDLLSMVFETEKITTENQKENQKEKSIDAEFKVEDN